MDIVLSNQTTSKIVYVTRKDWEDHPSGADVYSAKIVKVYEWDRFGVMKITSVTERTWLAFSDQEIIEDLCSRGYGVADLSNGVPCPWSLLKGDRNDPGV